MTIWLVRHGAAAAVPSGAAIGWSDPPLDATGRRQAELVAAELSAITVERVYSSDLVRARETAEVIASRHRLPIVVSEDLRELNFGSWEGRRLTELWRESPDQARAWEGDLRRLPAGFGETFVEFETRVQRFAAALRAGGSAIVVGHRGSLAVLYSELAQTSLERAWEVPFAHGSAVTLELA